MCHTEYPYEHKTLIRLTEASKPLNFSTLYSRLGIKMWTCLEQSTFYFYIVMAFVFGLILGAYIQSRAKFRVESSHQQIEQSHPDDKQASRK
jgi:hypothetical protein